MANQNGFIIYATISTRHQGKIPSKMVTYNVIPYRWISLLGSH